MKPNLTKMFSVFLFSVVFCLSVATAQEQWNWVRQDPGTTKNLHAVAWGESAGLFVAVGDSGTIITSPDGIEWTVINFGVNTALYFIIWGDGQFVAGGDNGIIITSLDGIEWTVRNSDKNYRIVSMVWGDEKYVAMTNGGSSYELLILKSNAGIVWTETIISENIIISGYDYDNIAWGGGTFIMAPSDDRIITSPDGLNWELRRNFYFLPPCPGLDPCGPPFVTVPCMLGSVGVLSIAYGNGIFLILGEAGGLARSENGEEWELLRPACWNGRNGFNFTVIYDGSRFVIAGRDGVYFTIDGKNLEPIIATKSWLNTMSMAYNGNVYVTVDGTEIGTLSRSTSIINSKQISKPSSGFKVHQKGKMLSFTLSRQRTNPQIKIYNIAGKQQKIKPVFYSNGTVSISISHLSKGMYILNVSGKKESWQRQIIIK